MCYCARVMYHFGYRGQGNISHMGVGSIHGPYIMYGPLRRCCTCVLYLFNARGQRTTSHLGERVAPFSIYKSHFLLQDNNRLDAGQNYCCHGNPARSSLMKCNFNHIHKFNSQSESSFGTELTHKLLIRCRFSALQSEL